ARSATRTAGAPPLTRVVSPQGGIILNAPGQSYTYVAKDRPQGYVQSWNIALQRALPSNFSVEAAFVGNHGVNIPTSNDRNINASQIPGSGAKGQPPNVLFRATADATPSSHAHKY